MKRLLTLTSFGLMLSLHVMADVGQTKVSSDSGTAAEDEKYVDELSTKESAIKNDSTLDTDEARSNQGQMYSKEDDQDRRYEFNDSSNKQGRD